MPADAYLFDLWFVHDSDLVERFEFYDKDWIGLISSNRQVIYDQDQMRVDALAECDIDDELYHIWTKKLPDTELGE